MTDTPRMIWRYDGSWKKVPDPIQWESDTDTHAYDRAGYVPATDLGWVEPTRVYEQSGAERWIVDYNVDASNVHTILVEGLPAFFDLMSKIAAISTAELLSMVTDSLEDTIYNTAEDGKRERKRRFR